MKQTLFLISFMLMNTAYYSQREITKIDESRINKEVENLVISFKKKLSSQDLTNDQIEFSIDTFRIRQVLHKRMDIDFSINGMNEHVMKMTDSYSKLLNKYYNKLLNLLSDSDKKVLVKAQMSWLNYRDSEAKLINVMKKEEYTGGGWIHTCNAVSRYSDIMEERTIVLFEYYNQVQNIGY